MKNQIIIALYPRAIIIALILVPVIIVGSILTIAWWSAKDIIAEETPAVNLRASEILFAHLLQCMSGILYSTVNIIILKITVIVGIFKLAISPKNNLALKKKERKLFYSYFFICSFFLLEGFCTNIYSKLLFASLIF